MVNHVDEVKSLAAKFPIDRTSEKSIFQFTKRVAFELHKVDGCGLLIKDGGENVVIENGKSYSISRVCYPDGQIYKILSDAGPGGANGPQWSDDGKVEPNRFAEPIPVGDAPQEPPGPDPSLGARVTKLEGDLLNVFGSLENVVKAVNFLNDQCNALNTQVKSLQEESSKPLSIDASTSRNLGHSHSIKAGVKRG